MEHFKDFVTNINITILFLLTTSHRTKKSQLFNSISLPKFFLKIPENSDYLIFCFQLTLLL